MVVIKATSGSSGPFVSRRIARLGPGRADPARPPIPGRRRCRAAWPARSRRCPPRPLPQSARRRASRCRTGSAAVQCPGTPRARPSSPTSVPSTARSVQQSAGQSQLPCRDSAPSPICRVRTRRARTSTRHPDTLLLRVALHEPVHRLPASRGDDESTGRQWLRHVAGAHVGAERAGLPLRRRPVRERTRKHPLRRHREPVCDSGASYSPAVCRA